MFSSLLAAAALGIILLASPAHGELRPRGQFRTWYPQYGFIFQNILNNSCADEYQYYLTGNATKVTIQWFDGADEPSQFVQPVVACLLGKTSDDVKGALSSAQVILGLTPTILAVFSASPEETALLVVVGKRPLLTFLLAVASPSVYTSRAFEYRNPREILRERDGRYRQRRTADRGWPPWRRWLQWDLRTRLVLLLEYGFACAALVNLGWINWDLATRTTCVITPNVQWVPAVWALFAVIIRGLGVVGLRLRARRSGQLRNEKTTPSFRSWLGRFGNELRKAPGYEWNLLIQQDGGRVYVEWSDETAFYICWSWALSVLTVCHIIFGTLIFSSTLFIGPPRDAVLVLARFTASALGCRMVLMYELAGLRDAYNAGLYDEAVTLRHQHCEHKVDCYLCGG